MKTRIILALALVVAWGAWAGAQQLGNRGFEPVYGVGVGGGGGGGGDITAVGNCTSGDCLTSGTTTMAGNAVFQGTNATQGVHSFGSAAQTTISAAGVITTSAAVDFRSSISNGGSATCFTGITGVPCFTESIAIAPASGDGVVSLRFNANTNAEGISFYDESNTLVGGTRFYGSGFSDADFANKNTYVSVGKVISELRTDDVAAGTTAWEVRDNALAPGAQLFSVDGAGNLFANASATRTKGTITLAAGTGTATVASGSICVCSDTTAINAVRCAVSSTTLTATGTGTDVIAYHCL